MADDPVPQVTLPDVLVTPDEQTPPPEPPIDQPATPLEKSTAARLEGYTWPEIDGHIAQARQTADQFGYPPEAVDEHLGYQDPDRLSHDLQTSTRMDTAAADDGTHPLEAASGGALEPSSNPDFSVKVNDLTTDQRTAYAAAVADGSTKSAQDFAQSFTDAVTQTSGHDASPATDGIAAQLPSLQDATDYAIGIAHTAGLLDGDDATQSGQQAAVAATRGSMMNLWASTGLTPAQIYQEVHNNPASMAALLNPPKAASVDFPPVDFTAGITKAITTLGDMGVATAKDIYYLPGTEFDITQKIKDMEAAPPNEDGTPKYSDADILAQHLQRPTVQLLASLVAGKVIGKAADILADPETAAAIRGVLQDISGGNKPRPYVSEAIEEAGRMTVGALLRSAVRTEPMRASFDDIITATSLERGALADVLGATGEKTAAEATYAQTLRASIAITDQRAAMAATIRDAIGESSFTKAMARQSLEGYFQGITPQVASYQAWIKDFQGKMQEHATAVEQWREAGKDPATYPPLPDVKDYHPLQVALDHMENRPGGGRVDPKDPMFPMVETIRELMQERRDALEASATRTASAQKLKDVAAGNSPVMGFIQDYFPHSWVDPKSRVEQQFSNVYGTGKQGSAEHIQKRSIPYIFDGIVRGLTPKFPNPIEHALHYIQGIDDFVASEKVRSQLLEDKHAYYSPRAKSAGDMMLKGRGATRQRRYIDKATGKPQAITDNLYAPRGYAKVYNHWAGKGFEQWPIGGMLYRKALMAKNASLGLALGMSGFHPVVISLQAMATEFGRVRGAITHGEVLRALSNVGLGALMLTGVGQAVKYKKGRRLQAVYMGTAAKPTDLELKLKAIYIKTGGAAPTEGRGEPYFASQARNLFTDWARAGSWGLGPVGRQVAKGVGMAVGAAAGAAALGPLGVFPGAMLGRALPGVGQLAKSTWNDLVAAVKSGKEGGFHRALPLEMIPEAIAGSFGRVADTLMAPLFDDVIPKIKMAVWADTMEDFIRRNPAAEQEAILRQGRQIMDSVDDRFGEMNMRNIFWNPFMKQASNVFCVSVGWEYGSWRAYGRSLEDLILKPQGQRFSARVDALLGLVIATTFSAGVYTYLATGISQGFSNANPLAQYQTLKGVGHAMLGIADTPNGPKQIPSEMKEPVRAFALVVRAGLNPVKWLQMPEVYGWGKGQPLLKDLATVMQDRGTGHLLQHLWGNHAPISISSMQTGESPAEAFLGIRNAPPELGGPSTAQGRTKTYHRGHR